MTMLSQRVTVTRAELLLSVPMLIVGFSLGELAWSYVFGGQPDWRAVYHNAFGAIGLALGLVIATHLNGDAA